MFWIIGGQWLISGLHKASDSPTTSFLYQQMHHVDWEGFRFVDLIMPLFLFIVGAAMPFSFNKRIKRGDSTAKLYRHIIVRFIILFVLGMVAQGRLLEFDLSRLRIFSNTLQAIAVGYLIAAILLLHLKIRGQIVVTGILLLLFWALMAWVPIPEHGAGIIAPHANLAIWLDHQILGQFQDGTTYSWLLSSLTFGCTTMLGVFAGQLLRSNRSQKERVLILLAAGVGTLLLGWIWGIAFPIVKHLWTSSFVLYSGGICYLLLALFYLVIDVLGYRKWAFVFTVIGMNAIAVYMVTRLFDFRVVADILVAGLADWMGNWYEFTQGLVAFAIIWLILWWMYRKKSFIKI